jgi:hypothetical protein
MLQIYKLFRRLAERGYGEQGFGEALGALRACIGKLLISGGGCFGYFTSVAPDDPAFLGVILLRAGAGWERG